MCNEESMKYQVTKPYNYVELNQMVKLGKAYVGNNKPVYIIAEAGLNHNGSLEIAKKLILEAKKSGCNAVKFQSFEASSRVSKKVKSVNYSEEADGLQENIHEMFKRLSLNFEQTKELFNFAKKQNIEIFSTPFDEKQVDILEKLNVKFKYSNTRSIARCCCNGNWVN